MRVKKFLKLHMVVHISFSVLPFTSRKAAPDSVFIFVVQHNSNVGPARLAGK